MRRICVLALGLLLPGSAPAEAHRLDEYLQATRLGISRDRVVVELDLTPGVLVAAQVFAMIDRDGDARVSPVEIEGYARRVLRDLSLSVDDRPCAIRKCRQRGEIARIAFERMRREAPFDTQMIEIRVDGVHSQQLTVLTVDF